MKIHVEVFIGSRILGKNQQLFSPGDLLQLIHSEFKDNRPGVSTHVSAACVANAPLNHPNAYNYLWRDDYGKLRSFRAGLDLPIPERANFRTEPNIEDVPEKYRYLLFDI